VVAISNANDKNTYIVISVNKKNVQMTFDHKKIPEKQQNSLTIPGHSRQNRILWFSGKWEPWQQSV